jgi:hypothetical protein
MNDKEMSLGKDLKMGHEKTSEGIDLVPWVRMKTSETTKFKFIPN